MHDKATVTERQLVQAVEFDGRSSADIWACMEREGYASETCAAPMVEEAKAAAALEEIKAARAHARLTIDIWRTLEASHRVVSTYP